MKKLALVASAVAFLCQPASAKEPDISNLDFGVSPQDPLEIAKVLMASELKDPDSAQYRWKDTYMGYCKAGWIKGGGDKLDWYGWASTIEVNAKNSFGGYTGFQPYTILYRDQSAVKVIQGAMFGAYGPAKGFLGVGGGAGVCQKVPDGR